MVLEREVNKMKERRKMILRCDGETTIIAITSEQEDLLDWLSCNDYLHMDVTYDYLENAECIEI